MLQENKLYLSQVYFSWKSDNSKSANYFCRFGFNGQEKDNEIYGEGNSTTAEYWQYDARLGRRWNRDPIVKPWESSYATFSNNPIIFMDPSGLEASTKKPKRKYGVTGSSDEEVADLKYLRKTDHEFNRKIKELNKKYKAEKRYLIFSKNQDKATGTMNDINIDQGFGKGSKEKTDYVYYTAIEGSRQGKYLITEYVYVETKKSRFYIAGSRQSVNDQFKLSTSIPEDIFHKWSAPSIETGYYDNITDKSAFELNYDFTTPNSRVNEIGFRFFNNLPEERVDRYDPITRRTTTEYYSRNIEFQISAVAMSKPIQVKVPIGKNGKPIWNDATKYDDSKLLKGETKDGYHRKMDYSYYKN